MKNVIIASAARTAIGSFNGGLSTTPAAELGSEVIKATLSRANIDANDIDEAIMGHVLTAGLGQNTAREAALKAGLSTDSTAHVINQVCGSGLRAVATAAQNIELEDAKIIIAGGQENMSAAKHTAFLRAGIKMGAAEFKDTMITDGLWDIFNDYHMGITAENIAEKYNISREEQDEFALNSQLKAEAAINSGKFKDEIIPITQKTRKGEIIIEKDEHPRFGATIESLASLRPAFKKDGTVTAGNASGLNDGAAAVLLMHKSEAEKRGIKPMARIASWATAGVDPSIMGTGPIPATKKALKKAGWSIDELDLIEANEAFAAQSIAVIKELGLDTNKTNINGGAIALGHPIGASGCRILVTLLHEMQRKNAKKALATLCIGGGMGIALCIERD